MIEHLCLAKAFLQLLTSLLMPTLGPESNPLTPRRLADGIKIQIVVSLQQIDKDIN